MDTCTLEKDIKVFCMTAKSFPDHVMEVHQKMHSMVPYTTNRRYFGISYPENGTITYKSAAEEINPGEAEKYNCEPFTIKAGKYTCAIIKDFRKDISSIGKTFQELLSNPDIDPQGYCLEWYLGQNDVQCMVRLKS